MKFFADRTVGKLKKILRLLGYDVADWTFDFDESPEPGNEKKERILLTRRRRPGQAIEGLRVLTVEANDPREQVKEVLAALQFYPEEGQFFSRCLRCNDILEALPREAAEGRVPDFISQSHLIFHTCPRCGRIYWPGSHLRRMKEQLKKIL
jgi:uncharacterized protein with PIN domain